MSNPVESGLRPGRLEYVPETTFGSAPTDPAWVLFSDSVQSLNFGPQATISPRRKVGDADIQDFNAGAEDHTFEVTYDLQEWLDSGAANAGIARNADGTLSSHSIVYRETLGDGQNATGRRVYYVVEGAKIDNVSVSGEPETGDPIMVTLSYMAQKIRTYVVDMPDTEQLSIVSSDAADTMNITVEDDGAAIAETFALTGTTPVTTTATNFATIDALRLASAPKGNITVSGVTSGNTLAIIYGTDAYDTRGGDLGIPALGSGSHGSALGGAYENFLGDTVERAGGTPLLEGSNGITADVCISSIEFAVANNLEPTTCHTTIGKKINEGARTITVGVNIYGEKAAYEATTEHLRKTEVDFVWTLTGGSLTFVGSVLTDLGDIAFETEQAVLTTDHTFTAKSLTIA